MTDHQTNWLSLISCKTDCRSTLQGENMRVSLTILFSTLFGLLASTSAEAGRETSTDALRRSQLEKQPTVGAVQNRFFVKTGRYEITPGVGYIANNAMVHRVSTGLYAAYHFSEELAAEGTFMYYPDPGNSSDFKGLTTTLVGIALNGSGLKNFRQPVEKTILTSSVSAKWSPIYGKINLIGESVLNFDFYGTVGIGVLTKRTYFAQGVQNDDGTISAEAGAVIKDGYGVPLVWGFGMNNFLNQSLALKLDARFHTYYGRPITPNRDDPTQPTTADQAVPYTDLLVSAGVSMFFPKMKPRLMDF